jgi:hypothetical protein
MANKKISSTSDPSAPPPAPRAPRKRTAATARPKGGNGDARRATAPDAPPPPTHEQIAEAAYHKYLSRQGAGGSDFDDWLEAERDLRSRSTSNPKSQ